MSGSEDRASARASLLPVVLVVLVTAVVVLVATLAASSGPTQVFEGVGPTPDRVSVETPSETPTAEAEDEEVADGATLSGELSDTWPLVGAIVRALVLALVVVALVLLAVLGWRRRPRSRASRLREDLDADFALVDPVEAVADAMLADADHQDAALADGAPRNGIVEAWLRFEHQAARAGVPREPWETSTEFAVRLLRDVRADDEATTALAELFRLARFSDHEVGEAERAQAAEALRRIRATLPRRAHPVRHDEAGTR